MQFEWAPRRGLYVDIAKEMDDRLDSSPTNDELAPFETLDLIYRTLCGLMYNYVPMSGHPGGSISSGRFVASLLFDAMDYDLGDPDRADADIVSYAAGRFATSWPAPATSRCCPAIHAIGCVWRTCSVSVAIRCRRRHCS